MLHEPPLGGATVSLLRVLPLLEGRGWSFSFWVPGRGAAEQELRRLGYDVAVSERLLRFSLGGVREAPGPARRLGGVLGYLRGFRAWLRSQDPDLVHFNTLLVLPELLARPRTVPAVLHVHEMLPSGPRGPVAARLARRADGLVAVSEAVAAQLRRHGTASSVVHPGVAAPKDARAAGDNGRIVVGIIGTVSKRKGSDVFLEAVRRLRPRGRQLEFRMVGAPVVGPERAWAEQTLDAARREGVLVRSGVDPFDELAQWDVLVQPSRVDPCPLSVLEGMAMGLPVVGSAVDGIPEELGRDAGLLVAPDDPKALAAAVGRLADSPDLRHSLGRAGRERARHLFTLERQAEGLDHAYRTALA